MNARSLVTMTLAGMVGMFFACSNSASSSAPTPTPKAAATPAAAPTPAAPPAREVPAGQGKPALLMAQAQFIKDATGKPKPGPALMTIWEKEEAGWKSYKVEDPDSNVFHKVYPYQGSLYTIGAEGAFLKRWKIEAGAWKIDSLWNPKWEGKFNRVRDLEIGDVNGDGKDEFVMATHDFGVVAVATPKDDGTFAVVELDKTADTFVHEVEIGDINGDKKNEFFVTPSGRNQSSGKSQPGSIRMYRWDGTAYKATVVDDLGGSHAKEILATDMDGDGKAELFGVIEAETEVGPDGKAKIVKPVEIRKYTENKDGTFSHVVIATIDDKQCRFLVAGDFDGDGKKDLVAAAMKTGIWFLTGAGDKWSSQNIETASSGFEHTTFPADLDGNGKLELYVAADEQRELRVYTWDEATKAFKRELVGKIPNDTITWNITAGTF